MVNILSSEEKGKCHSGYGFVKILIVYHPRPCFFFIFHLFHCYLGMEADDKKDFSALVDVLPLGHKSSCNIPCVASIVIREAYREPI